MLESAEEASETWVRTAETAAPIPAAKRDSTERPPEDETEETDTRGRTAEGEDDPPPPAGDESLSAYLPGETTAVAASSDGS